MSEEMQPTPSLFMAIINGTTAIPKAMAKLIDTLGDQIGLFCEPIHLKRMAEAKAATQISDAEAKAQVKVIQLGSRHAIQHMEDRAKQRIELRELNRQKNIEQIVEKASRELPDEVSDSPVDKDWVSQFIDLCEDVSNERMQTIWARLLAGEISRPGAFSPRTLSIVRTMTSADAEMFTTLCQGVWHRGDTPFIVTPDIGSISSFAERFDWKISNADVIHLESHGLVRYDSRFGVKTGIAPPGNLKISYFGTSMSWTNYGNGEFVLGRITLTKSGQELVGVAGATPNEKLCKWFVRHLTEHKWVRDY